VPLLEAYFDESGSHEGAPVLCVAGYLFERTKRDRLDFLWKEVLDRYSLPFFHMVDCAHGNSPFNKLTKEERIAVESEMIAIIREHALFGFAIAVVEKEYNELFPRSPGNPLGSAYTYCCWTLLSVIHEWIVRNQFNGKIAYYFEAGHKNESEANEIMNIIFGNPNLRASYRYAAHGFVDKKEIRAIQTADIIAWQHAIDVKRMLKGQPKRADFVALIKDQNVMLRYVTREYLQVMRKQIDASLQGRQLISGTFGGYSFVSIA
jgi:hypothetical protein